MIEVEEGQHCVVQVRGRFRVVKADKVTAKQIRTQRQWGMDREDRHSVVFAGTGEDAGKTKAALEETQLRRDVKLADSRDTFEEETAPARERREERDRDARVECQRRMLAIIDNATAGGEVTATQEG